MTQEQYVSFETAKLLKNKGFNELTFGVYVDSKCNVLYSINPSYFEEREMKADWNHLIWSRYASAPTQSFILRWLREKYKLYIVLLPKEVDENFKSDMCIYPMCSGEYEWMIVDGKGSKSIFGYNQNKRYGETYPKSTMKKSSAWVRGKYTQKKSTNNQRVNKNNIIKLNKYEVSRK